MLYRLFTGTGVLHVGNKKEHFLKPAFDHLPPCLTLTAYKGDVLIKSTTGTGTAGEAAVSVKNGLSFIPGTTWKRSNVIIRNMLGPLVRENVWYQCSVWSKIYCIRPFASRLDVL